LRDLLAIAKDSERGIATQNLRATDDARPAAAVSQAIVGDDFFRGQGGLRVAKRFGQPENLPTRLD